jgi:hypothetical protein
MTKQQLINRHKIATRAETRGLYRTAMLALAIGIPAVIGMILWLKRMEQQDDYGWLSSVRPEWVLGAAGIAVTLFGLAPLWVSEPRGVQCSCCDRKFGRMSVVLALLTGNCGFCGKKVVDDCDGKLDPAGPVLPS